MRVLFYSVNTMMKVPNFASELDIMKQHLDAGDEVFIIACQEDLQACLVNEKHWKSICYNCRSRFQRGMKLLGISPRHILPLLKSIDDSVLPQCFSSMDELTRFEALGINLGEGCVASVAAVLKDHRFDTRQHQALIHKKLAMSYRVASTIQHYLHTLKPDRVYCYNGRLAETRPVLNSCLRAGIDFYGIERAGTQGRYELYKNVTPLDIDFWTNDFLRLWAENPTGEREKLAELFYTQRRAAQHQGDRSFTQNQQAHLLPEGFDSTQNNIGVFITSEYELAGCPERDNPFFSDQNEGIRYLSEALAEDTECILWIRMHPNITYSQNTQLLALKAMDRENRPNLRIIWPDSKVDTYALMDAVRTVLTFGSTVGVEATYWRKPSVLAGRAYYEALDVCHSPASREELVAMLKQSPSLKERLGCEIYGHGLMSNGYPFQTFVQTELHAGTFLGDDLQSEGFWKRQTAYFLRKLDKCR